MEVSAEARVGARMLSEIEESTLEEVSYLAAGFFSLISPVLQEDEGFNRVVWW
jgi:hypothetical protein